MQNSFLDELIKSRATVFCFLVNGIKLEGVIEGYDQFSLILAGSNGMAATQMIMKSAISTIVPKAGNMAPKNF
ncbi:MAG: RNA chaperone Hfq [Thiolinea sp.]